MCRNAEYNITDKEYKFARAYVRMLNATKAAIEAGYPEASAGVKGCQLLKKVNVIACVRDMQEHLAETMEESAEKIVSEILAIARNANTMDRDKVKAFELAASLLGHNQPQKVEQKVNADVNAKLAINVEVNDNSIAGGLDELKQE